VRPPAIVNREEKTMRKTALLGSVALLAGLAGPAIAADWDALVHAGG